MSELIVLQKLLKVREQEKNDAEIEKIKATDRFEEIAKNLYSTLKKKEQAEKDLADLMEKETFIVSVKKHSEYMDSLIKQIIVLQQRVQAAREQMESKQEKLTEAYVEVKKVEKIIHQRKQKIEEREKKLEMIEMDEISVRQQSMTIAQNR